MTSNWKEIANQASLKLSKTVGWNATLDVYKQIADQIVADGKAEKFLKSARRGRPTVQPFRRLLVGYVENMVKVKRRPPRVKARAALPLLLQIDSTAPS